MRFRLLLSTVCVCLLIVLAGTPIVQAQTQTIHERNALWESRAVIGLPGDDEADDEGDDEGDDCPPYPAPVAATGQARCWAFVGGPAPAPPIDCAGTGQDGEYQAGASVDPRFTDNGDLTVTDNLTGLIWLRNVNCLGTRTFTDALAAVSALNPGTSCLSDDSVAGDWRLPSLRELLSLIDYDQAWPALPPDHPFRSVSTSHFWTSTTIVKSPNEPPAPGAFSSAWVVLLSTGNIGGAPKSDDRHVWPVRGPE